MINLYSVCNKVISSLAENIESVPYTIRTVLNHISECANNRFPNLKVEQRMKVIRFIFFQYFVIPGILDPQGVGAIDFMMLPELRHRLHIVCHILSYLSVGKLFPLNSRYRGMNSFIQQNQVLIDEMLGKILEQPDKSSLMGFSFLQRMRTSLKTHYYFGNRNHAATQDAVNQSDSSKLVDGMSPICISTEDLKLLLHILVQSPFMKLTNVPQSIKDALVDVANYHVNTLHVLSKEYYMIMNVKELKVQDQLPDETKYTVNMKSDRIKYLIQQLLISVKHIESSMIGRCASNVTVESILQILYHHQKLGNRMIAASTTKQLLQLLKRSNKSAHEYFAELHNDIRKRQQYVHDIIDSHKKLLIVYDVQQECVQNLMEEKSKLSKIIQSAKFLPFFHNLVLTHFLAEFRKCAFVEDQEKKLRNQYFYLKNELMQFAQQNFIPQTDLDNAYLRLKRLLLRRVYRLLLSPKGSPFQIRDEVLFEKSKRLLQSPNVSTIHSLEIPDRYHTICDCKFVQEELIRLDTYVLPRDKLTSITKLSSVLIELMRVSGDDAPSIDDFLPILIYNIIRANPPRLYSNLKYISRFDELFGEGNPSLWNQAIYSESKDYTGEYWLRHFEAAVLFIQGWDVDQLLATAMTSSSTASSTMSNHGKDHEQSTPHLHHQSFNTKREVERQFVRQHSRTLLTPTHTTPQPKPESFLAQQNAVSPMILTPTHEMTPSDLNLVSPRSSVILSPFPPTTTPVPTTTTITLNSNAKHLKNLKFLNTNHVSELKVSDIPELLAEYHSLVQQLQQLQQLTTPTNLLLHHSSSQPPASSSTDIASPPQPSRVLFGDSEEQSFAQKSPGTVILGPEESDENK